MKNAQISQLAVIETDTFKAENTRNFLSYYHKQRGDQPRPRITDLDWMEMVDIAPSLCIRDVIDDPNDMLCRFWGSKFVESYREECTGKLISQTYTPTGVENSLKLYQKALSSDLPIRLVGTLGYADKSDFVTFEGIMLCVDGRHKPKQHVYAVGQFDYELDDEDRLLVKKQQLEIQ